jgi:NAD(P)-dependent dehydrogenase (short-subunit alcohol dehydrogenase family)
VSASRLVVVTGGGSGIGRAVVRRFAAAGERVIAVGRDRNRLDEALAGGEARVCDVTEEEAVRSLFAELGPVDVLVANAGAATAAPIARTSLEQWDGEHAVNATGVFLCAREAVGPMVERGSGRVIVVASAAGLAGRRYVSSYTASKHAAVGFVRALAAELATTGVTVNAVCPTFVESPMTERSIERIVEATGRDAEDARRSLEALSPLGRLLTPEEVAAAVAYLASPEAGGVTGHSLVLGGMAV